MGEQTHTINRDIEKLKKIISVLEWDIKMIRDNKVKIRKEELLSSYKEELRKMIKVIH